MVAQMKAEKYADEPRGQNADCLSKTRGAELASLQGKCALHSLLTFVSSQSAGICSFLFSLLKFLKTEKMK